MSVRYVKLLFFTISFACFGAWADLSFDTIPITKHPSPSSYTVEQLAQEIKMPQPEEVEPLQPQNPQKQRTIDIITEDFKKFIQYSISFFKKIGDCFLEFLEKEVLRETSDKIIQSLIPTYISSFSAENMKSDNENIKNTDLPFTRHSTDPSSSENNTNTPPLYSLSQLPEAIPIDILSLKELQNILRLESSKSSTTNLFPYTPQEIDKGVIPPLNSRTTEFLERISTTKNVTYIDYCKFFSEIFLPTVHKLDENSKILLIRFFEKKILSQPTLNGNISLGKITTLLSSMQERETAPYFPDLSSTSSHPEKTEDYPISKQITWNVQDIFDKLKSSTVLQDKHKQIIRECITAISKTQTGKNVLQQIPKGISFKVVPQSELGNAGGCYILEKNEIHLSEDDFKGDFSVTSHINLSSTITHELTHAAQKALGFYPNAQDISNPDDYVILRHFNELHALLEEETIRTELFNHYDLNQPTLINLFKNIAIQKGYSQEQARTFARTEFARIFWSNTLENPEYKKLMIQPMRPTRWIIFYTDNLLNNMYYYIKASVYHSISEEKHLDLKYEIQKRLDITGIELSPDFILQKKSFKLENFSLTGFWEKEKFIEVNVLNFQNDISSKEKLDYISKLFKNNTPIHISAYITQRHRDNFYVSYFPNSSTPRTTYTIKDNFLEGIYKEYDSEGRQIAHIPFIKGIPHGKGWIIENGELRPLFLCFGFYL